MIEMRNELKIRIETIVFLQDLELSRFLPAIYWRDRKRRESNLSIYAVCR